MKYFNDTKRTRLKLLIYFGSSILLITGFCAYIEMESSVLAGLAAVGAMYSKYTHDETKRPSNRMPSTALYVPSNVTVEILGFTEEGAKVKGKNGDIFVTELRTLTNFK